MKLSDLRTAIAFYRGKIRAQVNRGPIYDDYIIVIRFGSNEWAVVETGAGAYRTFKTIDAAVRVVHQLGLSHAEVETRPR
ncbi:hypothetical protein SADO_13368 [Salinisphaera dokdonensis CL-ES53]|uniref:Uncharacterized protein n=1 Tax=Salinisphaera dokdonensis CL-ES53 TaxID=1304272 RepID=A0ABV2B2W6_9GAMM